MDLPVDPPEMGDYLESLNEPPKVWRVAANWLLDLDQYNEWMNEEDYEVDTLGKKKVHKLRLSVEDLMSGGDSKQPKGGSKTPSAAGSKRRRSPSPAGSGSTSKAAAGPTATGGQTPASGAANKRKGVRPTPSAASALGKKFKGEEDGAGEDLTRDMEDPPSDTNLREVEVPKTAAPPGLGTPSAVNIKKDGDWLPTKG
jgi:SWI/SNF related-matrix-associated actin-dependent regulator of chromatin subfamily C